jgi:serine/threonine protein kinase/tetratricopeptide (TPR) repeat protein
MTAGSSEDGAEDAPDETPATERVCAALELALQAEVGRSSFVGAYKLIEQIGEGGFGVVWLAEQREPIQRRVALKILKAGMDTKEVIARFSIERQALALMDHPHIARVFEAGETETGRPFFVMEFVRGQPLTSFCDTERLSLEQRLQLFISVCHGVQHAHQKGIIHRDLKPGNVLVAAHDGKPIPKIIDFGIAKALATPLAARTVYTQLHSFLGTPAYTSPEQMEMGGIDVDTRSDVYSLGVLLYELVAGVVPFDAKLLGEGGIVAMRAAVREADAPRPSQRLAELPPQELARIARDRGTESTNLIRRVKGDIDAVTRRCLEKDRTRRYPTAAELAADVQAHLDGLPIVARNPGPLYRAGKFVRRHKPAVAGSAAVLIALVGGLIAASILLVREKAARSAAVAAGHAENAMRAKADLSAAEARLAAGKSEQVALFMKDMLKGVGPEVALGADTALLRQILDQTTERLEAELHAAPEVATDLRETLGVVYGELGYPIKAELLLRQAVTARRRAAPSETPALATALYHLGRVLIDVGKHREADQVLQEAWQLKRGLYGAEHAEVVAVLSLIAEVPLEERTLPVQERMLRDVLDIQRRTLGPKHPDIATTLIRLAWVAMPMQEPKKAEALQREALAMRRALYGEKHAEVASALSGLGQMLQVLGDFDAARRARREQLLIYREVLAPTNPRLLVALLMFASTLPAEDSEDDLELARSVVSDFENASGRESASAATGRLALASLESRSAKAPASTAKTIEETVLLLDALRAKGRGPGVEVTEALDWCAFGMFLSGYPAAGLPMAELAARLSVERNSSGLPQAQDMNRTLGCLYYSLGRMDDAAVAFEKVVGSVWSTANVIGPRTHLDFAWLGASYRLAGRLDDAQRVLQHALRRAGAERGDAPTTPPIIGTLRFELGMVAIAEGAYDLAERHFRGALADYARMETDRRPWQRHYNASRVFTGLGRALAGQGKFAEAETAALRGYETLLEQRTLLVGNRDALLREALDAIIWTYQQAGRESDAAEWVTKTPRF